MYQGLLRCSRASVSCDALRGRRLAAEAERRVPVRQQEEDANVTATTARMTATVQTSRRAM